MPNAVPRRALRALLAAAVIAVPAAPALAAGGRTVKVTETDSAIKPATKGVAHGRVTFVVHNRSAMAHELVVIKTSRKAARLPVHGGRASEHGSVGEVEDVGGGRTKRLTLNLRPGHYALICNIPGHYRAGMHADFTVR
jgi:uncharacterized cupredoxin-like copper-binding protein